MKALILDSGTLINLSMNGLLYILGELKKISNVKFLATKEVKYETVGRPLNIPRFELGALEIQSLFEQKIIEFPNSLGISEIEIGKRTRDLLETANHSLQSKGQWINIVSEAEISCLALSSILMKKGIENLIAIDERTTRILGEEPERLENLMASKLHRRVLLVGENYKIFAKFTFIRSTELVYVAYKKGLLKLKDPKALEAALYATKFKGAAVSFEEINVLKKL